MKGLGPKTGDRTGERLRLESEWLATSQTRIEVFISHSTHDKALAAHVFDEIVAGIDISRDAIRCSSTPGNELELGDWVPDALRRDLKECSVVVALLTPASVTSSYVLMELGATWVLEKTACLLLAEGLTIGDLPGPFKSVHAAQLSDRHAIPLLRRRVAEATRRKQITRPGASDSYHDFFVAFVRALRRWLFRLQRTAPYGLLAALCAGIFVFLVWQSTHARYSIHLLTGNEGGQFYRLGKWFKDKMESEDDAAPSLEKTDGSVDNCERIEKAEVNTVALAWTSQQCGQTTANPQKKAKVVAALFPEVLHFLVHRSADTSGPLPDFRGKRVYFANEKSGTRASATRLLRNIRKQNGLRQYNEDEIHSLIEDNRIEDDRPTTWSSLEAAPPDSPRKLNDLSFLEAAILLKEGKIQAAFIGTGLKAPAVITALEEGEVRLVTLPPELIRRMTADDPDSHYEYASLENNQQLKGAYEPNSYGLTSSGYLASNDDAKRASSFKFDSFASDAVLLATESVDKEFIELLLKLLDDPESQKVLTEKYGVSRAYLERRSVLNQAMTDRGIRLNTGVQDHQTGWAPLRWRRRLWFSFGVFAVFVVVTVGSAVLDSRRSSRKRVNA